MIEKYLEETGLASYVTEEDKSYIGECLERTDEKIEEARETLRELSENVKRAEKELADAKDALCVHFKKTVAVVKKYNDSLNTGGIWNSVENGEKAKKLAAYYSFVGRIGKNEVSKPVSFPDTVYISELYERALSEEKRIRLLSAAMNINGNDGMALKEIESAHRAVFQRINSLSVNAEELLRVINDNELVLGSLLSALRSALDEKNNGKDMNISAARSCCVSFLLKYNVM